MGLPRNVLFGKVFGKQIIPDNQKPKTDFSGEKPNLEWKDTTGNPDVDALKDILNKNTKKGEDVFGS